MNVYSVEVVKKYYKSLSREVMGLRESVRETWTVDVSLG